MGQLGAGADPPPPAESTATYLGIPRHTQSPLLLRRLRLRLGKLARLRQGRRSRWLDGGSRPGFPPGSGRSSGPVLSAPSFPSAQPGGSPPRGLEPLGPSAPLPPLLHSRNASRSVAPFHHIRIGEASNSWLSAPRLGAVRPGRAPGPRAGLSLGQEAKASRAGAGRGGGSVLPGKEAAAIPRLPECPPLREPPHPSPTPAPDPRTLWECLGGRRSFRVDNAK